MRSEKEERGEKGRGRRRVLVEKRRGGRRVLGEEGRRRWVFLIKYFISLVFRYY